MNHLKLIEKIKQVVEKNIKEIAFSCKKEFVLRSYKEGRTEYSCGDSHCVNELTRYNKAVKNGEMWKPKERKSNNKKSKYKNKNCDLCGDEFAPVVHNQRFCKKEHKTNCDNCQKYFTIQKLNRPEKTCSTKCAHELSNKKRNEIIYKKNCLYCNREFEAKRKFTMHCEGPHYAKCTICNNEFLIKNIHRPATTCSESCASTLSHTEEAQENRKLKSLERHGVEHPFQAKYVIDKIKESLDNSDKDMRIGSNRWKEMLSDKYGVINISQVEEIKRIKEQTYYEKYGVCNPAAMQINNYKDWNNFNNFTKKLDWDCLELAEYFNTKIGSIRSKAFQTNSVKHIKDFHTYSNPELEVKHLLIDLGLEEDIDFIPHSRKIIAPLELDFYLPNLNIAIEVSPTYTHNSKHGWGGEGCGLSKNYHYKKLSMCNDKGVELITLFEWMDIDIVKSIINSKMKVESNLSRYKYKETNDLSNEVKKILKLKDNTFKGEKYKITTIEYNEKIIAAFIWFKNRRKSTLKYYKCNSDFNREVLINFAVLNYKETLESRETNELIIFSNSNFESDSTYLNLNFELISEFEPRLNYHNLKKNIVLKSNNVINSNIDKLENNNFLPIYDCGYKKWRLIL